MKEYSNFIAGETGGEGKILLGQTARVVRRERERDLVPTDVDVGMMARLLRQLGDEVHEFHRREKIRERERAADDRALARPRGHAGEGCFVA